MGVRVRGGVGRLVGRALEREELRRGQRAKTRDGEKEYILIIQF